MKCRKVVNIFTFYSKKLMYFIAYFAFVLIGSEIIRRLEKDYNLSEKYKKGKELENTLLKYNISLNESAIQEITKAFIQAKKLNVQLKTESDGKQESDWNLGSAIFFCCTTVTTIGYSKMTPATTYGRMFTIIYASVGIPITAVFLISIAGVLMKTISKSDNFLSACMNSVLNKLNVNEEKTVKLYTRIFQIVVALLLLILIFWLGPALYLQYKENWPFIDCLYFCFVSLTTIGLEDFQPSSSHESIDFKTFDGRNSSIIFLQMSLLVYLFSGLAAVTLIIKFGCRLASLMKETSVIKRTEGMQENGKRKLRSLKRRANKIFPVDVVNKYVHETTEVFTDASPSLDHFSTSPSPKLSINQFSQFANDKTDVVNKYVDETTEGYTNSPGTKVSPSLDHFFDFCASSSPKPSINQLSQSANDKKD